ncbi:hypothetical protein HanRHA438_Chr05g0221961 [Helianthus annuus]|nr:hypothetical protein HanRHA438_Chr05g0221961 [Helianthus annuus]
MYFSAKDKGEMKSIIYKTTRSRAVFFKKISKKTPNNAPGPLHPAFLSVFFKKKKFVSRCLNNALNMFDWPINNPNG